MEGAEDAAIVNGVHTAAEAKCGHSGTKKKRPDHLFSGNLRSWQPTICLSPYAFRPVEVMAGIVVASLMGARLMRGLNRRNANKAAGYGSRDRRT